MNELVNMFQSAVFASVAVGIGGGLLLAASIWLGNRL